MDLFTLVGIQTVLKPNSTSWRLQDTINSNPILHIWQMMPIFLNMTPMVQIVASTMTKSTKILLKVNQRIMLRMKKYSRNTPMQKLQLGQLICICLDRWICFKDTLFRMAMLLVSHFWAHSKLQNHVLEEVQFQQSLQSITLDKTSLPKPVVSLILKVSSLT